MAKRGDEGLVGRCAFLKGATLAGAGALAAPLTAPDKAEAQDVAPPARAPSIPAAPDREAERGTPTDVQAITQSSSGADFMLDVMRGLRRSSMPPPLSARVSAACMSRSSITAC